MKITSIELRNYKKFLPTLTQSFHPDLTLLVGQNGSGKSSILQMIAAVLGTATQELRTPSELNWTGFNFNLINSGRAPLQANLNFSFTPSEITATRQLYDRLVENRTIPSGVRPGNSPNVNLSLIHQDNRVNAGRANQLFQFRGYSYAKTISYYDGNKSLFNDVGKAYWYTEERNTLSFNKENGDQIEFHRERFAHGESLS